MIARIVSVRKVIVKKGDTMVSLVSTIWWGNCRVVLSATNALDAGATTQPEERDHTVSSDGASLLG